MTCPSCHEPLTAGAAFCEACGAPVTAQSVDGPGGAGGTTTPDVAGEASPFEDLGSGPISAPTRRGPGAERSSGAAPAPRPCLACGEAVDDDGYCTSCGTKQPSERDHFRETPASWVAGVCDRGLVHVSNEDAMALLADEPAGSRAVLVVLDGVSSSTGSDVASLAGARAARDTLLTPLPRGMGTEQGRTAAVTAAFAHTIEATNAAIVETTDADSPNPASATFSVAVVEGARLSVANIGDSRVYWVPDDGEAVQVTVDDSAAQQLMEAGMDREAAENGPHGHAITRWLGRDAPDLSPRVAEVDLVGTGWVLNCSDGLWNYVSEPAAITEQLRACVTAGADAPLDLALALTAYANARGGRDNITVTLARIAGHNRDQTNQIS
ncbi:PP2C family serine/threonine-protein phosphatase [Nocardioides sp.]|uniref:PP2C family serine/threonine-protein phosphatase n=1 Tax=Nocardioides sp. TaxID=35761 RepID=UPI002B26ABF1|nr:PP2C family serine/threonine-protein phosphatase [Nocardioides sp.]